jgi:hypothetical protein
MKVRVKMSNSGVSASVGIGPVGLLTILFVALKLTGVIAWSWVWVLSPIWIVVGIGISAVVIAMIVWGIANVSKPRRKR